MGSTIETGNGGGIKARQKMHARAATAQTRPSVVRAGRPHTRPAGFFGYRGGGAILTTSVLGPFFGAGLVQWMSPLRLAVAVAAFASVMLSFA